MPYLVGLITIGLSLTDKLSFFRILFGHLFILIFAGWPLAGRIFKSSSVIDRLLSSSLISILLTYPATVLVALVEGKSGQAIFSPHLTTSLFILLSISWLSAFIAPKKISHPPTFPPKPTISLTQPLLFSLFIFSFFSFTKLGYANVYGDEYDLGYQAYNLVDGIQAGRNAYLLSYSGHPPLTMSLKHYSLNLLEPKGLDHLSDWHFRFSEALLGLLTLVAVFALSSQFFSTKVANLAVLILATNNYFIWLGRIFHREMLLTFLLTLTVYYFFKVTKAKRLYLFAGLSLGAALLVKETALVLMPTLLLLTPRKQLSRPFLIAFLIFLPVVLYNILAFLVTGYADVFFSNLFGVYRPGATPRDDLNLLPQIISIATYLIDLFSPLVLLALTASVVFSLKDNKARPLIAWIVITLLFFLLTAVRGYYFVILAIPLVIITARRLTALPRIFTSAIAVTIVLLSSFYSFNTHIRRQDTVLDEPRNIDGSVFVPVSWNQTKSSVAIGWAYNHGWLQLLKALASLPPESSCVTVDDSLNSLAVRRYLSLNDDIKAYYLGKYPSRFPRCLPNSDGVLVSKKHLTSPVLSTISDSRLTPQFFLYHFSP